MEVGNYLKAINTHERGMDFKRDFIFVISRNKVEEKNHKSHKKLNVRTACQQHHNLIKQHEVIVFMRKTILSLSQAAAINLNLFTQQLECCRRHIEK